MLCSLGCGQEAIKQSKNGNRGWCNESANRCPAKREKDSSKKKGVNLWIKNPNLRGRRGKVSPQKGKKLHEIYGQEKAIEIKQKLSESLKKPFPYREDPQYLKLLSDNAKKHGLGGVTRGGGRGKKGRYKGVWCDSSWELAWVIYQLDHQVEFARNTEGFEYIYKNKNRKYFPDFVMPDKSFVEIKGYDSEQFTAKVLQFQGKLIIYRKDEMQEILDYVHKKYGENFISMYDNGE